MPLGELLAVGMEYSVNVPPVVTLATLLPAFSVNHRLPSGPATMAQGELLAVGTEYSVTVPAGVTLAILLAAVSATQRLPSGPWAMPVGWLELVVRANSLIPVLSKQR